MQSLSLKTKMSLAVSLLVMVLMAVSAFLIISHFEKRFRETIAALQFALVSEIASDIDKTIQRTQAVLAAKAASLPGEAASDSALAQRLLNDEPELLTLFDNGVFLYSPAGRIIAEVPDLKRQGQDFSHRDYIRKTAETGRQHVSTPYFSAKSHHHPIVMFTAPLFGENGRILAILGGSIDLTEDNFLGDLARTKIGSGGYIYIYDTGRTIIMHPDRGRILQRNVPPGVNRVFDKGIAGFNGTEETVNSRGLRALTSVRSLKTTNWIVGANYPLEEAYAPIREASRFSVMAVVAGVLVSVLIVWLTMKLFIAPLGKLTGHIRGLSERDGAGKEIRIAGGGEIGELAGTFNAMMLKLHGKQEELRRLSGTLTSALAEAEKEKARSEAFIAAIGHFVSVQDTDYRIIYQNPIFREVMGDHVGEHCYRAYHGRETVCAGCLVAEAFRDGQIHRDEKQFLHADGKQVHLEFTVSPVRDASGKVVAAVELIQDVTERKKMAEALRYMGSHDSLTGLFNRTFFDEELARFGKGRDFPVSIVIADIDGLKSVNDRLGHAAGDGLIRETGKVLQEAFRAGDIVARIGGDEFGILLPRTSIGEGEEILERIRRTLQLREQSDHSPPMRLSLGIATAQVPGDLHEAMMLADNRMYQEKSSHRSAESGVTL